MESNLTTASLNYPLDRQGIETKARIHANLGTAPLVEQAVANGEGLLAAHGPFVVNTGKHTGRSAKDKFIVRDAQTEDTVWWGDVNVPMSPEHFAALKTDFLAALAGKDKLYVADLFGGSQPEHRVNVRVINELAWHNLFIRTLLVRPDGEANSKASCPNIRSSICPASAPIRRGMAVAARRLSRSISPKSSS